MSAKEFEVDDWIQRSHGPYVNLPKRRSPTCRNTTGGIRVFMFCLKMETVSHPRSRWTIYATSTAWPATAMS